MISCRPVLLLLLLGSLFVATIKADDGDGKIVRFSFRFGFFEDELTPVTEVIKEDVEAVVCQTQYFLSQLVQNATQTKSVHAKATEIDWGYYENQDLPAHINFTVEFTDAAIEGDVNWVDDQILIDRMEALGETGLQAFITNYVWVAEPVDLNFFKNANRMAFDGERQMPVNGNLEEAECPETIAPTGSPTVSPAPTNLFNDIVPPPAPTAAGVADDDEAAADLDDDETGAGANATDPDAAGAGGPDGEGADDDEAGAGGPLDLGSGPLPNLNPTGSGNGTNPNWPFGPNYESLSDLDPMTDYALSFSLFDGKERPPNEVEVNNLLCEINDFFTAELRRELNDNTIHAKAIYVDYYFLDQGAGAGQEDIIVNFTTFAYYGDEKHTQVHADDVFEAMKVTDSELKSFVVDYVWKSEPEEENVFYHTESLSINAGKGRAVNEQAMLIEALGCVLPPAHGDSGAIPPPAGAGGPNNSGAAAEEGGPNQGLGGDAKSTRITTAFRVSNLENIKTAQGIKAEGLDASFPSFVHMIVEDMTKRDSTRRLNEQKQRSLRVVAVTDSATIDSVIEFDCPGNALPGLTCHEVTATYDVLMTSDEDENQINNDYTDATNQAANNGPYNNELQRTVPDTPLYIGIMTSEDQIPPGSQHDQEDDGWFKWWYLLLLLLLLLLCCLLCLLCVNKDEREPVEPETKVYEEREVLVEEFEEDEAPHGEDDDEEFVEDDYVAPSPVPAPAGAMVPYDPEAQKRANDQAQREKILNKEENEII